MNTLRILRMISSRHFRKEMFLLAMLTAIVTFSNVVLEPVETHLIAEQEIRDSSQISFNDAVHFNPTIALQWADHLNEEAIYYPEVHNQLWKTPGTKDVLNFYQRVVAYEEDDTVFNINLILYSQNCADYFRFPMQEGEFLKTITPEGYIPIVVTPQAVQNFPIGSVREIQLLDYTGNAISFKTMVTGIVDWNAAIPVANSFGNIPSMSTLGLSEREFGQYNFILAFFNPTIFNAINWDYTSFAIPQNGIDIHEWQLSLSSQMQHWGTVNSLSEIERKAFQGVLKDHVHEQLNFYLLVLVALFGYGGYLFLGVRQNKKKFATFYILGMPRWKMLLFNLLQTGGICLVGIVLGWSISPWIAQNIFMMENYQNPGWLGTCCSTAFLLISSLLSLLTGFMQYKNANTIALYKGGD